MKKKLISFVIFLIACSGFFSIEQFDNDTKLQKISTENVLKVHYIDVKQGDSIFIELPNDECMLIDAGEVSQGNIVSNYISNLGYEEINYVVGTHPHTDHIGGLINIINDYTVDKVYLPKVVSSSKTYETLLNGLSNKNIDVFSAKSGVNIIDNENLKVKIIAPVQEYKNLNNCSAVVKIIYGNKKFLFMGDAEIESENDITEDVSADVIKIGHHGSDTSSSLSFIQKVNPKYVVVMVGENNQYNHPSQNIIKRWENNGAEVFRTDINGNIIISTDGNNLVKELEHEVNN